MISRPPVKRVLIVNCYFDPLRIAVQRKFKIPPSMAPAYLAGVFSSRYCQIRLYDEVYSGPLEDEKLAAFPDMLILTGLNVALDRMRHVTAYVKTKNPKAIVVAGGPAIRALYHYSRQFFDYCCRGDWNSCLRLWKMNLALNMCRRIFWSTDGSCPDVNWPIGRKSFPMSNPAAIASTVATTAH